MKPKLPLFHALVAILLAVAGGGFAQPVDPADYGTLSLHLKADALALPDNSPVTEWGPLAAAAGTAPTYVAADPRFNHKPAVRFDGVDDLLYRSAASYKARTVFIVGTLESNAASLATLVSNGNDQLNIRRNDFLTHYRGPDAAADSNDFSNAGQVFVNQAAGGNFSYGTPHLLMEIAGAQRTFADFWLGGASAELDRFWKGSVAEVLVYEGTLTPTAIDHVGFYLQEKYALPTNFPPLLPAVTFTVSTGPLHSTKGIQSSAGAPVTLSWSAQNATSLSIDQGVPATTASGSVIVSPAVTTTYTLSATNAYGTVTMPVTVHIGVTPQPAIINEFIASNSGGYRDEDGDSSDWIEIYNPNDYALDLQGYTLKDGSNQWTFPTGSLVEAGGYRLVFPSSKNRNDPAANLHTNFGLSAGGEYLGLLMPSGEIATEFSPAFPAQRSNISMGKQAGSPVFYRVPTPLAENGDAYPGAAGDVQFSTARGFFTAAFPLTLSCTTPGATIRYTTDASTPTLENGITYTAPLTISATTTLRAAAFFTGYLPSPPITQTYLFLDDVLANQVYPGAPPAGWPAAPVNNQKFRYGWNSVLKAQYSSQQLLDGLKQIPSLSIVTDQPNLTDPVTGIYVNADKKGDDWERQSTVEYLPADGSTKFHVNAGLRIRGGNSRSYGFVKHSLRLQFRGEYGDSNLEFPLHGNTGTDKFETLDLRTEQNYHWANDGGTQNTAVREVFCRDLMTALGQPTTRSRYVHLYLNGQYWGIYQTEERAQEDYGASYFGGTDDDYDVIQTSNHPNFTYELSSGTITAWQTLWNMARAHWASPSAEKYFAISGRNAAGQRVPGMPVYLDVDNLISYMLTTYYTGDGDAPLSNFLGMIRANNWRGMRNRYTDDGFRFFVHDAEHTLRAAGWVDNRTSTAALSNSSNRTNFTYSNPEWIHEDLSQNAEYRIRFADLAQKFLFNNGPMTQAPAQALFDARAAQINQAIIPDAARWGTSATNHTFAKWQAELAGIRSNFFATRTNTLVGRLRSRGFFPTATAPIFGKRGGQVAPNYPLTLSQGSQTGQIYYTLDGSDPRAVGGAIAGSTYAAPGIPLNGIVTVKARFLSSGGIWSALDEAKFSALIPAAAGNLVISKIHYRPPSAIDESPEQSYTAASDFEYIELLNISPQTLDLTGVKIQIGITFDFANSSIQSLAPGARVVIVGNSSAFPVRYGGGLPVAGMYGGALSNSGETVRIADANNDTIVQAAYGIASPWPTAANGNGASLVLKNPASIPDPNLAASWRASYNPGGKPGEPDLLDLATWRKLTFAPADLANPAKEISLWGNQADPDNDGLSNLVEFATGSHPLDGGSHGGPVHSIVVDPATSNKHLTLTSPLRGETRGLTVSAVAGFDLLTWPDHLGTTGNPVLQPDGNFLQSWRDPIPFGTAPGGKRFMRLVITDATAPPP